MVIDDEEFCIAAMQAILGLLGIDIKHHVDFCNDGQEAINKLKRSYQKGLRYKIIFTDFNMPLMDGIEATKKIRKMLKHEFKQSIEE